MGGIAGIVMFCPPVARQDRYRLATRYYFDSSCAQQKRVRRRRLAALLIVVVVSVDIQAWIKSQTKNR